MCVSLDWIVLVHALIAAGLVACADEFRERHLGLTAVQETQVYVRTRLAAVLLLRIVLSVLLSLSYAFQIVCCLSVFLRLNGVSL